MAVTQKLAQTYETSEGFVAGNLDTQVGYALSGASAHQATVDASSKMSGAQSITFTSGGATTYFADEKSIGYTRLAAQEWVIYFQAMVETGATVAVTNSCGINITAGAINTATFATDALDISFGRNGTTVDMLVADKDYPPATTFTTVAGVFALDTKVLVRVRIFANDAYTIEIDSANTGESWTQVRTGSLVAANVLFSRYSYTAGGPAFVTGKNWFDNLYFSVISAATKANLGTRVVRCAVVSGAVLDGSGQFVTVTYDIKDSNNGTTLATGRTVIAPAIWFTPTDDRRYVGLLDQLIADDLKLYDIAARVATFGASGHGLDF